MTKSIESRLEQIEQKLCISDKPVVFEYTDGKGVEHKAEIPSTEFDKLLQEIDGKSKGLPVREGVAV